MAFDWQEFALFADQIRNDPAYQREAGFRAAISRYYYAAHWATRLLLECDSGVQMDTDGIHSGVVRECLHHSNTDMRRVGERLKRLMRRRNRADYEAGTCFSRQDTDSAWLEYRSIVGALSSVQAKAPPTT